MEYMIPLATGSLQPFLFYRPFVNLQMIGCSAQIRWPHGTFLLPYSWSAYSSWAGTWPAFLLCGWVIVIPRFICVTLILASLAWLAPGELVRPSPSDKKPEVWHADY